MSQILKLAHENQQLKRQVSQYKQVLGVSPFIDDSTLKGGYRVVKTITDRDKIDCCHRKQGMKVLVIGEDLSFKEYILKTNNCKENIWEEVDVTVEENEVFLIEDYSELAEDLETQRELNLILKALILQLQQDVQNIEVPINTSELINDGADGVNPFITAQDIPAPVDISKKAETDASNIDDNLHIWRQKIDANYVHDQAQPSSIWTINHPLNKKVSVTVTDTAGTVVEGQVIIKDNSQVIITFNSPFSGIAVLN